MRLYLVVSMVLGLVVGVSAQVVINEVGWSGTIASGYDEWIELFNPGEEAVDLSGWTLLIGEREMPLSGEIPAGGFFLLERTDDSTVADVEADFIYKGALPNAGAVIQLLDPNGDVVDTANRGCPEGWWAGGGDVRASMERISPEIPDSPVAWRPGTEGGAHDAEGNPIHGTPGAPNAASSVALPVSLHLPGEELFGQVEIAWEVEGGGEGLSVSLYLSQDGGESWELVAQGLPLVGVQAVDTSQLKEGEVLFAVGVFDEVGARGGAVSKATVSR